LVEVVDANGDMAVGGTGVICSAVVVEGELELLLVTGIAEELIGRLEFVVPDDW
jgi:hypothetical protein